MVRDRELKLSAVVLAEAERPTREGREPTPYSMPTVASGQRRMSEGKRSCRPR
jgi:hypothetical protein